VVIAKEAPPIAGRAGRPLRIVQMGPTGPVGGVSNVVIQLSGELARQGHEVVLVGDGAGRIGPAVSAGAAYEELPYSRHPLALARHRGRVQQLLARFRPDIVHVHGRAQALLMHYCLRSADWFTLHNTHLTEQVAWYDRGAIRRFFSPLGKRIFALDERAVSYLRDQMGVATERIHVIPNGIDCRVFRPPTDEERACARASFGIGPDRVLAVFVGRFHEQKNPQAVLRLAAAAARQGLESLRVVLIGDGPLEQEIRAMARRLPIPEMVEIRGWCHPVAAYQAADLLVMPSRYEGFGLVGAEALACGTPVLRSRTGGFRRMIGEGVTGWGCDGEDEDDFVTKALQILGDRQRLASMRPECRKWALEKLDLGVQARRTVAAYRLGLGSDAGVAH
jgi:glycosyltransferase involved in cell wall biosynthesis